MVIQKLKSQILSEIKEAFKKAFSKEPNKLELVFPPDINFGDFAVEFFKEAKELGINPAEVAEKVEESFEPGDLIKEVESAGPYLNIRINSGILFESAISEIEREKEKFGSVEIREEKKVMVEYLSPNTNKPLHLGHARNGAIGMALANILESQGYDMIKANLINDRGVHICKSMLAYVKWGNGETPENAGMKGDHFVGKYYVKFAEESEKNPELEKEVQDMLKKWEAGDEEVIKTWRQMNEWVYEGFNETYKNYNFRFDEIFYESDTYKLGKDIVEEGLRKNIFRKDETESVVFDLPEKDFGRDKNGELKKQTVLRADGTSVYMTQDIGTAVARFEKYNINKLIYIVGSEQIFHFQALFNILKSLGYSWAKELFHLPHGMVNLPEGKMKSREGKVVDAGDLLREMNALVSEEVGKREADISEEEKQKRSEKIALGAIKFYLLRVRPAQDIKFNPEESISLDGFTGSYCQYAYARICGILRNAEPLLNPPLRKGRKDNNIGYSLLGNDDERALLKHLIPFPDEVKKAAEEISPLSVVSSVYEIAKAFNLFYNNHKVLDPENKKLSAARLSLVKSAGVAIKKGLSLLSIDVLERM